MPANPGQTIFPYIIVTKKEDYIPGAGLLEHNAQYLIARP